MDEDFCLFLEGWIGDALGKLPYPGFRGFWCDGVLMNQADACYSQKYINGKRQAQFRAWIGEKGQTAFDLYLAFGPKALSRYARSLEIRTCMPDPKTGFHIDPENKVVVIQLS